MKKVISVINHKGGVGKTTSTANIGSGLQKLGKKVLLIDFDPQSNLTVNLGIDPREIENNSHGNIYEALHGKYPLPVIECANGVHLVSSTLDLSVAEMKLINEPAREFILSRLINPVKLKYDFILIDCPPSLGFLTLNALTASQSAIIPVELASFSLVGMKKLFDIMEKVRDRINPELDSYRILVTRTDKRQAVHRELSEYLAKEFAGRIFQTEIRSNVKILESQLERTDIFSFDPKSKAATDYGNLCKEFIAIYCQLEIWQNQE
jgi:chromosome partitioning protein